MDEKNRERIEKIYLESVKYKFLQDKQKEKFNKMIDTLSDLYEFKSLNVEYLDMIGAIYFTFVINDNISMEIGSYDNGETVYSIKVGNEFYKIDNDLSIEEIIKKMNNVIKDIEK